MLPHQENISYVLRQISLAWVILIATACNSDSPSHTNPSSRSSSSAPEERAQIITNLNIFNGEFFLDGLQAIKVDKGRVVSIGRDIDEGDANIIDGNGMTLIPGLIDAHTHTFYESNLYRPIHFGVTTHLDMHTHPYTSVYALNIHEENPIGSRARTDLFTSEILATSSNGHGTQFFPISTVSSPAAAATFVRSRAMSNASYIKLVYEANPEEANDSISLETAQAIINTAHELGLLCIAHVSNNLSALDMVRAGIDGLAHALSQEESIDRDLMLALQEAGTFVVPTLAVFAQYSSFTDYQAYLDHPKLNSIYSADERSKIGTAISRFDALSAEDIAQRDSRMQALLGQVTQLYGADVPLLVGTDAPNSSTLYGLSIHQELELLVLAGMPETEALISATGLSADIFGIHDRGKLIPGRIADFVLIDGDPRENISVTRNIHSVWKNGRLVQ